MSEKEKRKSFFYSVDEIKKKEEEQEKWWRIKNFVYGASTWTRWIRIEEGEEIILFIQEWVEMYEW